MEWKFLRPSAEVVFEKFLAYIAGHSRMTGSNWRLLRQHFENGTEEEKSNRLKLLAESGGFLEIE